jgi:hypothetical protein
MMDCRRTGDSCWMTSGTGCLISTRCVRVRERSMRVTTVCMRARRRYILKHHKCLTNFNLIGYLKVCHSETRERTAR